MTLIVRVSAYHHIHTFTQKLADIQKIMLPKALSIQAGTPVIIIASLAVGRGMQRVQQETDWLGRRVRERGLAVQVVSTEAKVEGWGPIADVAFYKEQQLAVLSSSGGGVDEAHFLLLPMEPILHASSGPGLPGKADGAASQVHCPNSCCPPRIIDCRWMAAHAS